MSASCSRTSAAPAISTSASAAASKAASVASHSSVFTRVKMLPSPSATRRMTRASTSGNTCLIWYAIDDAERA